MDARRFLQDVGSTVSSDFSKNRSLLSFEEYLQLFSGASHLQARNAAQYLKDAIDSFGTEMVQHPSGQVRRFKVFDAIKDGHQVRVAGQEEVQNALYRLLGNFVRAGRINKLILMHGPNGSAKSSTAESLKRGLEIYSQTPEGALYTFNWVFPKEKLVKGSIGFGDHVPSGAVTTYAHLAAEDIEVRLTNPLREHPLFLIPREERRKLLDDAFGNKDSDASAPAYLVEGELSTTNRKIFDALLASYSGDWLKVLRHVQVERFYVSRRYQVGTFTVEPQMSVDAAYQQVSADRTQANLPSALHSVVLFQPVGPLVSANRGLIEYTDLLKRPLEAFKYLLGFSETQEVSLEHMVLQLDEVLLASSNEKHLAAFKELPDFSSFKGRIELVRVPYLRRWKLEREVYDAQVTPRTVGRHVAPHATRVAAMWAVLTRLKKPIPDRYPSESRSLVERLSPMEKLRLYQDGEAPDRLTVQQQRELKKLVPLLYEESDSYPNYEGRSGASAREIKTALFNAAQSPEHDSLHPLAVLKELMALTRDKSVYEYLQQEIVDGYHDHAEFVRIVENDYLDVVDREVRDSMGLVSEAQYVELFERYVQTVSAWIKGERVQNKHSGAQEKPNETSLAEFEGYVMPKGEDATGFRRALISTVGAWRIDNPEIPVDYARIFPDLFKRLSDHFYEERKRQLKHNVENILKVLSDERGSLSPKELAQVKKTMDEMVARFGYTQASAKDAIVFLVRKRYA
ncbi:MAG: serine protein kinase PrkA [Archangium sp.]|nr:serine protein kinase PrkA [Archangium sp.]MDP3571847.1 serine protein kinase PrkA [Archangium sp.]